MEEAANEGIGRKLVSFSTPLILSGVLQQLYSWADAFIVGNVEGEEALAAIGSTVVVTNLFIMAVTGFTSGVGILSARCFGSSGMKEQRSILSSFSLVLCLISLLLSAACMIFSRSILAAMDTPGPIIDDAAAYLRTVMAGLPFVMLYNVCSAVLRGTGNSRPPFYAVLVSSGANVLLDIVLVAAMRTGVTGAAAASAVSQAVMAVYLTVYTSRKYEELRMSSGGMRPDRAVLVSGCRLGVPVCIQSVINAAGSFFLQDFMNGFGTATVAAITTAYRVDSIILLPLINLGTAVSTMTAQFHGAGKPRTARRCLYTGSLMTAAVSLVLAAIVFLAGAELIELFGVTASSACIGRRFFRMIAWFYILFGLSMAMRGYIEGSGRILFSSLFGILSLAVRIILSYALVPFFGNMVIALAEALSWCFLCISCAIWIWARLRRGLDLEEDGCSG